MDESETTFDKIKQLLRKDPFVPFVLRCGNRDIAVSHPNAAAFHPEVPFLTVYDRTDVFELPVAEISYVQRQPSY